VDPNPDPDSLARHEEMFGTRGGRGVFRVLPPGVQPIPVVSAVARFEGEQRPRLLEHVGVDASPEDSLFATWVVKDSNEVEVMRTSRVLSPSACDPTAAQVADFAADLAPGRYRVGLSVRGAGNRRGATRDEVLLEPVRAELSLSDLMVSCGVPDAASIEGPLASVRIEPNPEARVAAGAPLTAYFEIYHLSASSEGLARFDFEYTVRSMSRDARVWLQRLFAPRPAIPSIHAEREEQQIGSLRRQFVSVPVQSLPAGLYRLEIRVRDRVGRGEVVASTEFVHEAAPAAP
jgi:hypothetical protein